jgi:tetratricopeptide (TPR) repeat protein
MTEETGTIGDTKRRRLVSIPVLAVIGAVAVLAIAGGVWYAVSRGSSSSAEEVEVPVEGTTEEYAALETELAAFLEKNPDDLDARRSLASVLSKQGKYEDAIREYNQVIDADATDHASLYEVGILQRQTGLIDDALKSLQAAVDITGEAKYLDDFARTCMQVGRYEDAIAAWLRVLEDQGLEPQKRAETLGALSQAYQDAKKYDEAKAALQEAVALMPDDANLKARLEAMGN